MSNTHSTRQYVFRARIGLDRTQRLYQVGSSQQVLDVTQKLTTTGQTSDTLDAYIYLVFFNVCWTSCTQTQCNRITLQEYHSAT